MTAKKKRKSSKRQAVRRERDGNLPAWMWGLLGVVMGLGLAIFLAMAGLMPRQRDDGGLPKPDTSATSDLVEPVELAEQEPEWQPRYDFYTVLPEMEVVIPSAELEARVQAREDRQSARGAFLIQVGSFRDYGDADRSKAELALLGLVASIHEVSIDNATWYRVRLGPYPSLREVDGLKRRLQDQGYQVLVLSERSGP